MSDQEVRERILQATLQLLTEEEELDKITVRRIAEKAGVGIGSINYHFQSKDNLLNEAVAQEVGDVAASWYQPFQKTDVPAITRLRKLFTESARVLAIAPKFGQIMVNHSLLNGEFDVPKMIWPLLREIYGVEKSELEIRLIAFQLIVATQLVYIRADAFQRYSGADVYDEEQRNAVLNIFIDNILSEQN